MRAQGRQSALGGRVRVVLLFGRGRILLPDTYFSQEEARPKDIALNTGGAGRGGACLAGYEDRIPVLEVGSDWSVLTVALSPSVRGQESRGEERSPRGACSLQRLVHRQAQSEAALLLTWCIVPRAQARAPLRPRGLFSVQTGRTCVRACGLRMGCREMGLVPLTLLHLIARCYVRYL